jgi:tRNA-Thr(GGU) m(6)t(6)A37 methyltransferase TsaA
MEIIYRPIGILHTEFKDLAEMPIQPTSRASGPAAVEVFPEYVEGLKDLEGFSHLILIYHLHAVKEMRLTVTPFLDAVPRGVFATRAPTRPNPIGLSIVELLGIDGNRLRIGKADMLDGTPVLDIKPFVPDFDQPEHARIGWLESAKGQVREARSDRRFS